MKDQKTIPAISFSLFYECFLTTNDIYTFSG